MARCVFIDLSGTLHVGRTPLPGAIEAVNRLRHEGYRVRFVSNTSSKSLRYLQKVLSEIGFDIALEELFTAPLVVRRHLLKHNLRPYLLVHPDLEEDFSDLHQQDPNAVVVGCALQHFTYANLNHAFRLLKGGRNSLLPAAPPVSKAATVCNSMPAPLSLPSNTLPAQRHWCSVNLLPISLPPLGKSSAVRWNGSP
nr:hypothetical protein [Syntrophotalea acetylenivorans]